VQDNGIGIAPEYQRKIFGIFERVPTPKTKDSTGIGLAIVSKAIERLGGTVGVISEPGVGSTFWFELPGARAVAGNGDRHSRTASPPEAVVIA
jgi:signal transduction histidine kinase